MKEEEKKEEKKWTWKKIGKVLGIGVLCVGTGVAIYDHKNQIADLVKGLSKKNNKPVENKPQNNNFNNKKQNWK